MSAGNYFEYEDWTFTQDLVESGNLYRSRDLLSASLEVDTLNITVECNDPSIVNFRRNAKLTRYFNGVQDGIFYVQSIKRVAPKLYTISATSKIGLLQNGRHMGGIYAGETAEQIAKDICGTIPVSVKSNIKDIKLYGWLPIATPRENLSQVLFATGATVKEDMLGTLRIEGLWDGVSSAVPADRIYNDATVEYGSEVSGVSVTEHQYVEGGELESLFEGTASYGDVITFSEPHYGLEAAGFSILESGANYAKISSGSGTLQGRPYVHNTRQITKTVNAEADENIKTVSDATLVSLVNSNAVAERMVSYYKCTEVISAPTTYGAERTGDRLSVYHPFDHSFSAACLESEDITLSGKLRAQEKSLVGFVPTVIENTVLYEQSEIISTNRAWSVPDGVTTVRAVLIGGGSGGGVGEAGNNGTAGKSCTAAPYGGKGVGEQGIGGNGGAAGAPGPGGYIHIVDVEIETNNREITITIGAGGAGETSSSAAAEGGETKLSYGSKVFSSKSGNRMDSGFPDVISGITYGKTGSAGIPGASGGDGSYLTLGAGITPAERGEDIEEPGYEATGGNRGTLENGFGPQVTIGSYTFYSYQYVKYAGGGGGAAASANGNAASRSTGGKGADAGKPSTADIFGTGGTGGNGGGGGGGGGGTQVTTNERYNGSGNCPATTGGAGGSGSSGGDGAPGCVILYYGIPETVKGGQLKDRTGKMALDRYGRRIIM